MNCHADEKTRRPLSRDPLFMDNPMRFVSSVLVAAFVLAGCDNPGAPSSDLLTVSAANQSLEIRNTSSERVY